MCGEDRLMRENEKKACKTLTLDKANKKEKNTMFFSLQYLRMKKLF
jgi:hypothetical protein